MSDPDLEAFYNRLADRAIERTQDATRVIRALPLHRWFKAAVMRYLERGRAPLLAGASGGRTSSRLDTDAWTRVVEGSVDLQNSKTKGG